MTEEQRTEEETKALIKEIAQQDADSLNEVKLTWAGKLFFASVAAYVAADVAKGMKLPIKLRGRPDQIKAATAAIMASKSFQKEISKPGAKVEDVIRKLNIKNMTKQKFKSITGKNWPV